MCAAKAVIANKLTVTKIRWFGVLGKTVLQPYSCGWHWSVVFNITCYIISELYIEFADIK